MMMKIYYSWNFLKTDQDTEFNAAWAALLAQQQPWALWMLSIPHHSIGTAVHSHCLTIVFLLLHPEPENH